MDIRFVWRGYVTNAALNALHAEGFDHEPYEDDWEAQLDRHSLGWVCAYNGDELVGFVNVAWDGGVHAFVVDTLVAKAHRRRGIGTRLMERAASGARAAGCEWLHVDFDPEHQEFYIGACGFSTTDAGLRRL